MLEILSPEAVKRWQNVDGVNLPSSISCVCGHCGDKVLISLSAKSDINKATKLFCGNCPGCGKRTEFATFGSRPQDLDGIAKYPSAPIKYQMPTLSDQMPVALKNAVASTIDSFNSGNYTATAVTGRRALEGMFKYLVPEGDRKKELYKLIEQVKADASIGNHLTALSHLVRKGGNLGAHFDEDHEPNEILARQIVELVDYLGSYLYLLPDRLRALEEEINAS